MPTVVGRAVLFGFPETEVVAEVRPRARAWRITGAARAVGVSVLLAPVAAIVPPHAPWALGVLAAGAVFGRRRWTETHTLMAVTGSCPKCSGAFSVKPGRLKRPHPLECEGCHHVSALKLPEERLGRPE
ncbi:MAG: hypothetical protein WD995_06895 [Gemmatimonadota bacterium]